MPTSRVVGAGPRRAIGSDMSAASALPQTMALTFRAPSFRRPRMHSAKATPEATAMTLPTACPGESRSRKKSRSPTRKSGADSSSPRVGRSWSSTGLRSSTHSGAVSWRKMALALVVALLASTKSSTVKA